MLKAPPARMTSREARISRRSPAAPLGLAVGAVEPRPGEVLDADRPVPRVEQHPGRERVELDVQAVRMPPSDVEERAPATPVRAWSRVVSGG